MRVAIVGASIAAAALVAVPVVMGVVGVGGTLPAPIGGVERLYYGHPNHQPAKVKAVITADRKRIARCAMLLATNRRSATCPSPVAFRKGRNAKVLAKARWLVAKRGVKIAKRQNAVAPDVGGQWSAPFTIPSSASTP